MIADDDEKWLAAATAAVKQNAFYMQRAIVSLLFSIVFFINQFSIGIFLRIGTLNSRLLSNESPIVFVGLQQSQRCS